MSEYLVRNKRTSLSKIIFSVRSKTLDIKEWLPWNYTDNKCVACKKTFETMDHFMTCTSYRNNPYGNWREINGNNVEHIEIIGIAVEKRKQERKYIIVKKRLVAPRMATPQLQETVELCYNYNWFYYL